MTRKPGSMSLGVNLRPGDPRNANKKKDSDGLSDAIITRVDGRISSFKKEGVCL
jgi:hypothetical protein